MISTTDGAGRSRRSRGSPAPRSCSRRHGIPAPGANALRDAIVVSRQDRRSIPAGRPICSRSSHQISSQRWRSKSSSWETSRIVDPERRSRSMASAACCRTSGHAGPGCVPRPALRWREVEGCVLQQQAPRSAGFHRSGDRLGDTGRQAQESPFPAPFSPMIPMIAPSGATASNPAKGALTTLRKAIAIKG